MSTIAARERQSDEEDILLRLSDEYADFIRLVISSADMHLLSPAARGELNEQQQERKHARFAIRISLFERAYARVYEGEWGAISSGCGSRRRTTRPSGASARIFAPPCRPTAR